MPTLLGHLAPALCLGTAAGKRLISRRLLVAGLACSLLPDLDVIGFKFGIAYGDALGHRGLSHSLVFAFGTGVLAALAAPLLKAGRFTAFVFCGGAVLVHIFLDALTNGGLGVALWWPWSDARWFFPVQPIEVCPFSPRHLLSERGVRIMASEGKWIWGPSLVAALCLAPFFRWKKRRVGK